MKHRLRLAVREKSRRFYRWEYFWLALIVIAALAVHLAMVVMPRDIILDEVHYINDARFIAKYHVTERPEHPPLAKLLIEAGIKMFGDNPWGWRILPILFSTATLIMFYILCRRLNMSRTAASIAVFLLAFENLNFLMSSLAMLDVYFVTFMMAAFLPYVYRRYIGAGVAIGLSGLAKLYGALSGPVVFIHWVFSKKGRSRRFLFTIIFAIVTFLALMPVFDYAIRPVVDSSLNPITRVDSMLSISGSLTFQTVDHPSKSYPWEWLYTYKPFLFYGMPHWMAAISFEIWALIIPVFIYMLIRAFKKDDAALFGVSWFAGTYLVWIPITIITQRVAYIYYFYPTVGAVCLGLGIALAQLIDVFRGRPRGKVKWLSFSAVVLILAAHVISFLILSPVLPVDFAKMVGYKFP